MENFRHSVGDNVGAVTSLVPWLFWNVRLEIAEDDGFCDQPTVPELIILRGVLRPRFAYFLSKLGEVLLPTP